MRTLGEAVMFAAALLLLAGCGGGAHSQGHKARAAHPGVCLPAARGIVATAAAGAPVTQRQSTGNNAQPQCSFRSGLVAVIANVDTSPQPYARLERAVVEAGQQFSVVRDEPPPERVAGLGLDADWFPRERQLLTANSRELITVTVSWRGATKARMRALGVAVARVYLGRR